MEIHIPEEFTAERPALNFYHHSFDINIDEHGLGSTLPAPTGDIPSVQKSPADFIKFGVPCGAPTCLEDYLESDLPQLTLYIVSFNDTTLVSICWPHICADAVGLSDIGRAWSLMLAGRGDEIPPMLSFDQDPMAKVGVEPQFADRHVLESLQLKGVWLFLWGIRFILDMIWWRQLEMRTIFLPRRVVQSLHRKAMEPNTTRAFEAANSHQQEAPFLTEGDVLAAWMTCNAASVLPRSSTRTVGVSNAFDLRARLGSIFPAKKSEGAYVQNAVFPFTTNIPARNFIRQNALQFVAQSIRHNLNVLTTEAQIHAFARLSRASLPDTQLPPVFGDTSLFLVTCSNWTKAGIFDALDFKAAALPQNPMDSPKTAQRSEVRTLSGKPIYFHVQGVSPNNMLARNMAFFFGMPNGDYWVNGCFPPEVWTRINADLSALIASR